jgi:hypothetical protein
LHAKNKIVVRDYVNPVNHLSQKTLIEHNDWNITTERPAAIQSMEAVGAERSKARNQYHNLADNCS